MDNLTHTLTGALLARAGLGRLSPRGVRIALLAANIPDIDVASLAGGGATYMMYHRWATHTLIALPIMAMLPVLLVALFCRTKLPWFRAWLLSLVCVASHLFLDFTNMYGIRLWLPFSDDWPALDITNVIDLWIWAILLAGLVWPMLSGLVGSEIGAKSKPGTGAAIVALVLVAVYDAGRFVLHQRAVQTLESRVYDGAAPRRAYAFPHFANPMRWEGWIETERSWQAIPVDLATDFDPEPASVSWKADPHPAFKVAQELPIFQVMMKFARTPLWRVTPSPDHAGANLVELVDLRFGRNGRTGFTATAIVDGAGKVLESGFHF
jgi:inner membrane protein